MQNKKFDIHDRRITNVILHHWNEIRGERRFPSELDLKPEALDSVIDSCFLLKARELIEDDKYNYKYIGPNIVQAYTDDLTTSDSGSDPLSQRDKIKSVILEKKVVINEGEFINRNRDLVKYRQCLVPLGSSDSEVEAVLGGLRYNVTKQG